MVGNTTTGSLADSLPDVISAARLVREFEGVMPQLVEHQTLGEGIGLDWSEVSYDQLTAQNVTENTVLNNAQQISDSLLTITPTVAGIKTVITDRVAARITKKGYAKLGSLAQNAIQRKKDEDGLTTLDSFTTSLGGAGTVLTSGHVRAGTTGIQGNTTEPGNPPYYCVIHPNQGEDIVSEIVAGVGTYPIGEGLTARVFSEGFRGTIGQASIYYDGNMTIDASDDAKGGVFAKEAIILVQGRAPRMELQRLPDTGGGANAVYHYDEYAFGIRSNNWGREMYFDATAPTS